MTILLHYYWSITMIILLRLYIVVICDGIITNKLVTMFVTFLLPKKICDDSIATVYKQTVTDRSQCLYCDVIFYIVTKILVTI